MDIHNTLIQYWRSTYAILWPQITAIGHLMLHNSILIPKRVNHVGWAFWGNYWQATTTTSHNGRTLYWKIPKSFPVCKRLVEELRCCVVLSQQAIAPNEEVSGQEAACPKIQRGRPDSDQNFIRSMQIHARARSKTCSKVCGACRHHKKGGEVCLQNRCVFLDVDSPCLSCRLAQAISCWQGRSHKKPINIEKSSPQTSRKWVLRIFL